MSWLARFWFPAHGPIFFEPGLKTELFFPSRGQKQSIFSGRSPKAELFFQAETEKKRCHFFPGRARKRNSSFPGRGRKPSYLFSGRARKRSYSFRAEAQTGPSFSEPSPKTELFFRAEAASFSEPSPKNVAIFPRRGRTAILFSPSRARKRSCFFRADAGNGTLFPGRRWKRSCCFFFPGRRRKRSIFSGPTPKAGLFLFRADAESRFWVFFS